MAGIVVGVETNEIAVEDTKQDLVTDGEDSVNLGAGEGSVQEETNLDILLGVSNCGAQHFWDEHKVIVMHPNNIAILYIGCNSVGKQLIHFLVCLPVTLVESDLSWVIME